MVGHLRRCLGEYVFPFTVYRRRQTAHVLKQASPWGSFTLLKLFLMIGHPGVFLFFSFLKLSREVEKGEPQQRHGKSVHVGLEQYSAIAGHQSVKSRVHFPGTPRLAGCGGVHPQRLKDPRVSGKTVDKTRG